MFSQLSLIDAGNSLSTSPMWIFSLCASSFVRKAVTKAWIFSLSCSWGQMRSPLAISKLCFEMVELELKWMSIVNWMHAVSEIRQEN